MSDINQLKLSLQRKIYNSYKSTTLPSFTQKIDKGLSYYHLVKFLDFDFEDFLERFNDIIEEEVNISFKSYNDLWQRLEPCFSKRIKEVFFGFLKNDIAENEENVSKLLQWNDYCNFINNSEQRKKDKIEKVKKQKIQKQLLDEQIFNKKPLNELLDKTLKDMEKLFITKAEVGSSNYKKELEDLRLKSNKDNKDFKERYIQLIKDQCNYNKNQVITDFDYTKDCVRLDKKLIYQLRNSSSIFSNT